MTISLDKVSIKDGDNYVSLVDLVYPVGSIYIAWNNVSPAGTFGGTWAEISNGYFLCANGSGTNLGATGGSNTKTLTTNELPAHTHTGPSHRHALNGTNAAAASGGSHKHQLLEYQSTESQSTTSYPFSISGSTKAWRKGTSRMESDGAHTHTLSGYSAYEGTGATGSAGSGKSFNNMPAYITVRMYKRTA